MRNVDPLIVLIGGLTGSHSYNSLFSSEMFPPNGRARSVRGAVNTINSDQHPGAAINIFNTPKMPRKPLTYEGEAL